MNKTKIDWCDATWNPVTGCLNGCEYCYARKIAHRFGQSWKADGTRHVVDQSRVLLYYEAARHTGPYPYGFDPTLYLDRLSDPVKYLKPQNVFVCSMADLFGDWVPHGWIRQVFEACESARQHTYLFLTKNPERYLRIAQNDRLPPQHWYGTTATSPLDPLLYSDAHKTFISIEPILEPFEGKPSSDFFLAADWVIIGAETGNRPGKVVPPRWWIEQIADVCAERELPLYMKSSLAPIWGEPLIQQWPKELKTEAKE